MRRTQEVLEAIRRRLGRRNGSTSELIGALAELALSGPVPVSARRLDPRGPLKVAVVIPSFRRGSGGHGTIVNLMRGLRDRGHEVSLWLEDCDGLHDGRSARAVRQQFSDWFGAADLPFHASFDSWAGSDITLATGWQTVPRTLLLPDSVARAYLVQDHEPEFYGTSAEASFAADTYRQGLPCIAASPWLAQLLRDRYGATASSFDLGVDHDTYRPGESSRRADLVVFYARASTPRRAVPLGLVALHELARRRPDIEIALFGGDRTRRPAFAHTDLGPLDPRRLARLYQEAAVGLSLSLTNPSLVGLEMMACGLPCVELASAPMRATFAGEDALELAAPEPLAIAAAIERVLDDPERREQMSARGVALTAARTWGAASAQVEAALREALPS